MTQSRSDADIKKDEFTYLMRLTENVRFFGGATRFSYYYFKLPFFNFNIPIWVNFETQVGASIQAGGGLLLALALHFILKYGKFYTPADKCNPLFRNFKTLASLGAIIGTMVAFLLPFAPSPVQKFISYMLADCFGLIFGLLAIPYWFLYNYLYPENTTDPEPEKILTRTNKLEGWSKYAKTALVFGTYLGCLFGAVFSYVTNSVDPLLVMSVASGICAVGCFGLSLIAVPLINWLSGGKLSKLGKDDARNNYWRSLMTLGASLGAIPGFFLGSILFAAAGAAAPMLGAMVGAALFSVILGAVAGKIGWRVTEKLNKELEIPEDTNNSWDYACRTTSFLLGNLGTVIGLVLGGPVGAFLGGAIGGAIGWFSGLATIYIARKIEKNEDLTNKELPWTQRVGQGANIGSTIGLIVGLGVGFLLGGPAGGVFGAMLGQASMAFILGAFGALYGKKTRELIAKGWDMLFSTTPATEPTTVVPETPRPPTPDTIASLSVTDTDSEYESAQENLPPPYSRTATQDITPEVLAGLQTHGLYAAPTPVLRDALVVDPTYTANERMPSMPAFS